MRNISPLLVDLADSVDKQPVWEDNVDQIVGHLGKVFVKLATLAELGEKD